MADPARALTSDRTVCVTSRPSRCRSLRLNVSLVCGGVVIFLAALLAALAPIIAPHDPLAQDIQHLQAPPSHQHLLGTDDLGRDILSRALYGMRLSLLVGVLATALAVIIGSPFGLVTGYAGRWLDAVFMRFVDAMLAFPGVLLALLLVATIGPSMVTLVVALGVSYAPLFARTLRGATLVEREKEYVLAAVACGSTAVQIVKRHILPNIAYVLWVQGTLTMGLAVLSEATLSYLGVGAPPEIPSWGRMILEGRPILEIAPYLTLVPLVAVSGTILGFNLLGNGLADISDPRLRGAG